MPLAIEMRNIHKRFGSLVANNGVNFGPVSYTHLDVYKRQT